MKRAASSSVEGTEREPPKNSSHEAAAVDRATATATAPVVVKKQKVRNAVAAAAAATPEAVPRQAADTTEAETNEEKEINEEEANKEEKEKETVHLLLVPQLELMPLIPAQPPTVPVTDEEEVALTKKYRYKYQTRPAPVYKAKDYALVRTIICVRSKGRTGGPAATVMRP